jgi:hypothetical protein
MPNSTAEMRFVLHGQPSEADYDQALAAHGVWMHVGISKGIRNRLQNLVLAGLVLLLLILPLLVYAVDPRDVRISLGALVGVAVFPSMVAIILLVVTFLSPRRIRPSGIIQHRITASGKNGKSASSAGRGLLGWALFLGLAVFLFFLQRQNRLPALPIVTPQTPRQTPDPAPLIEIPGFLFFAATLVGTVFIWWISLHPPRKLRPSRKQLLEAFCVPRTYIFTEDTFEERTERRTQIMQWAHFQKFVESPAVVLLYPDDQTFHIVPRSIFTSDQQYDQFMGLLMRKIPDGMVQPRPTRGFTVEPLVEAPPPV